MKPSEPTKHSPRQIRFTEGAILFVIILAITIFIGVKLTTPGHDAKTATTHQVARNQPAGVTGEAGQTEVSALTAEEGAQPAANADQAGQAGSNRGPAGDLASTSKLADSDDLPASSDLAAAPSGQARPNAAALVEYADAEAAYFAKQYTEAADLFTAYTAQHPDNAWGHYMLGLSSWKNGDLDAAAESFHAALNLQPQHVKSLVNLGRVLLAQQEPAEALPLLEQAVQLEPSNADAYRVLGRIHDNLQETDAAITAYREALRRDDQDAWSMNNLGLVLIRCGRGSEALPPLARATELAGDVACFQNNLGIALERCGYVTAAAAAYERALAADPDYEKADVSLARVQEQHQAPDLPEVDLATLARQFQDQLAEAVPEGAPRQGMIGSVSVADAPDKEPAPEE
jgi:tetratricopeptide (TPR) repeat protein